MWKARVFMVADMRQESHLLRVSVYAGLAFAFIGIIWGLLSHSQMVIFDGFYSFLNTLFSLVGVFALRFIQRTDDKRFPFGKSAMEPLSIVFQTLGITFLCVYAIVEAVLVILSGGSHIDLGLVILYAVISTLGCLASYLYLAKHSKTLHSAFVNLEKDQWLLSTLLSVGVLVGFTIGLLLSRTNTFTFLLPYIDPFMVLVMSPFFLRIPLTTMVQNVKELLDMPPEPQIQQEIETIVQRVAQSYAFAESFVRLTKVGRSIFIEIDFVIGGKTLARTIEDSDAVREEIYQQLQTIPYEKWFTVSFTADRKWAI
jgi:cation diffusion facilitator family transporter